MVGGKNNNNKNIERVRIKKTKDEDLIIEENTIYEIDRECYERLKKKKRN